MLHLGDITKINGAQTPVVDCVIGGSPCQDLSVAGLREGFNGKRSVLYMDQIRIIKEMREADALRRRSDDDVSPRYMVWENVGGAFSANSCRDFQEVLGEAVKIIEPEAPPVPIPEKGWPTAGCLMGDRWSIAWRVLDAQFWGVPQRRRRICLVCDFNGHNAPWIVFGDSEQDRRNSPVGHSGAEPRSEISAFTEGVRGYFAASGSQGEGTAPDAERSSGAADSERNCVVAIDQQGGKGGANYAIDVMPTICSDSHGTPHAVAYSMEPGIAAREGGHIYEGVSGTLRANAGDNQMAVAYSFDSLASNSMKSNNPHSGCRAVEVAKTLDTTDPNPCKNQGGIAIVQTVTDGNVIDRADTASCNGNGWKEDTSYTLNTIDRPAVAYGVGNGQTNQSLMEESVGTLNCMHDQQAVLIPKVAHSLKAKANCDYWEDSETYIVAGLDCRNARENGDLCGTLQSKPNGGFSYNCIHPVRINNIVRRLTPLECERLQGFPDGWTDIGDWVDSKGKKHKAADSPRYKALGNSIAIPPWKWVLKRLCACYERDATMASLFDGIGGFPYIWEQLNGKGSCLWASEIDEFPMAVTKVRFRDDNS